MQKTPLKNDYKVGTKNLTVDDKLEVLKRLGREDLIDLFKEWKPKSSPAKKRGAPLDQRVTITITNAERAFLDTELVNIKRASPGSKEASLSGIVRSRAITPVDVHGWKEIAEKELAELEYVESHKKVLAKEIIALEVDSENAEDDEEEALYQNKIYGIRKRLDKLKTNRVARPKRLTGRMTRQEAERIKWYSQRLCISASDYMRMLIFNLQPGSSGDSHMTVEAKKRFYISIIDVALNGWGESPAMYSCTQCDNYLEQIQSLQAEVKQLRVFT